MVEIPESRTIAAQLNEMIKEKSVKKVVANMIPHGCAFFSCDPNFYQEMLLGKPILYAKDTAGLIEIKIGDVLLLFSDGAQLRYFYPEDERPKKHQLCVRFSDDSSIVCTVKLYGGLWAYYENNVSNEYYKISKEKPHPLDEGFSFSYFEKLLYEHKNESIKKAFLQDLIPGLGNGSLQEILYNAKLNFKTNISSLKEGDIERLYFSIKETLLEMCGKCGRDTEYDLFGNRGGYKTKVSKFTYQTPCPRCGDTITRKTCQGTRVYFCPTCQKE